MKTHYTIEGQEYPRIPYGKEKENWGADKHPCSSCGAEESEFHTCGCFVERCPKCDGQAMTCQCGYQEDFERKPMSNGRRVFYKFFYLGLIPFFLTLLVLKLLPMKLSGITDLFITVGIPALTLVTFWKKMGEMELNEVITTNKKKKELNSRKMTTPSSAPPLHSTPEMKRRPISIFLLTIWLAPLVAPSPRDEKKKEAYLKKIEEAIGNIEKATLLTVIGGYFFHAGLFIAAPFVTIKWNGFELWATLCSIVWIVIAVACLVSGFRLLKMVEPDSGKN